MLASSPSGGERDDSHCEGRSDAAIFGEYGMLLPNEIATSDCVLLAMTRAAGGLCFFYLILIIFGLCLFL